MAPQHINITTTTTTVSEESTADETFVTIPISNSTEVHDHDSKDTKTFHKKRHHHDNKDSMNKTSKTCAFSSRWTKTMECIKAPLLRLEVNISHHAASYPKTYILSIIVLSIALFVIGITTNFTVRDTLNVDDG